MHPDDCNTHNLPGGRRYHQCPDCGRLWRLNIDIDGARWVPARGIWRILTALATN